MNRYDIMNNSLKKNIQELCEFLVDNFNVTNYYDLTDYMVRTYNFIALVYQKDKKLAKEIEKELNESEEK
jgi:trans-2-enoyl-CoA reductase